MRFVALVSLNPNHLGACSLYLCARRKVKIIDRGQTCAKNEAEAETTLLSGFECAASASCSFFFVESEALGLMLTQFLIMEKSQDY